MSAPNTLLGVFHNFNDLDPVEQELVSGTWIASQYAYTPLSSFPVGSTILARNDHGDQKIFHGCNVEGNFFGPTICAERNAASTAIAEGYRHFLKVALVCAKYQGPGASPCGLCRQVLTEFGRDGGIVLNMADRHSNVRKFLVSELLPAASGTATDYQCLAPEIKRLVTRLQKLLPNSYVPYSKKPHAAIFIASNANGKKRRFTGVSDDSSKHGGLDSAECFAMRCARTAGFAHHVTLAVTVDDPHGHNPIEGRCLQVLRNFGLTSKVLLVGPDRHVVEASIAELLPDSFGPDS
jgi:cytidine deaminase